MPTSRSKNSRCATRGHARSIPRRRWAGESVTNRSGSSATGRMLHRPPPLIRILRPPSLVRSMTVTEDRSEANIAAARPAAPAPTTTVSGMTAGQRSDYLPSGAEAEQPDPGDSSRLIATTRQWPSANTPANRSAFCNHDVTLRGRCAIAVTGATNQRGRRAAQRSPAGCWKQGFRSGPEDGTVEAARRRVTRCKHQCRQREMTAAARARDPAVTPGRRHALMLSTTTTPGAAATSAATPATTRRRPTDHNLWCPTGRDVPRQTAPVDPIGAGRWPRKSLASLFKRKRV
jgi:hypothetical protein